MSKVITKADLIKSVNGEITKVYPNTLADNVKFDVNSAESVKDKIKTLETSTTNISNRVTNIIATSATDSNISVQEILDARTSSSGTEYASLGDAIRNQINDITEEIKRKHARGPNIKYKIETKIGSAIGSNGKYHDTNPDGEDNTRACSPSFYPTYGAKSIHIIIESGYKIYIVQYKDKSESGTRYGGFIEEDTYFRLDSSTNYIRVISRKIDDSDMQVTPEINIIINADIDYVTPQMYKYTDDNDDDNNISWDEAFELAMETGKIIFIPEGIYQLEGSIDIDKDGVCMIGAGYNSVIRPPRCFNEFTKANRDDFNEFKNADRTMESDAFKYTYAIKVGPVTGVRLSNFRIQAQYEEEDPIERDLDENGNDIGPIINVKGTRGCGIITTKAPIASRNYFNNLWIEGCLIGIVQRAIGSIFSNITIQGLLEHSDFMRKWKNWYKNDEVGKEPVKYNTLWQHVGVITTGTDSYWSDCAILWNDIGLYCYSGGYFSNVKALANRYNCIIGQKNNSYGNELVTNDDGNTIGAKTCLSVKMSNCYFQEAKCSNLLIYNAMSCSIEANIEAAGDTYYPARLKCKDFDKDDVARLPISNIYIDSMSCCDLNITTKLGSSGGYERYLIYCAASRAGFNTIKCCVTGPSAPLGHRFDMFGGRIFGLLASDVYINNVNMRDMGLFDETYVNSPNIIDSNRITIKPYISYINGEPKKSSIKVSLSDAQIDDTIAFRLGECSKFGGRFIFSSEQLLSGLTMSVLVGKIINNQVYIIDGQSALFTTGISNTIFTTQTQVHFGRDMTDIADYALCLKITNLPEINFGENIEFTISDFTYGLIK